jgi:hypothetical protein
LKVLFTIEGRNRKKNETLERKRRLTLVCTVGQCLFIDNKCTTPSTFSNKDALVLLDGTNTLFGAHQEGACVGRRHSLR